MKRAQTAPFPISLRSLQASLGLWDLAQSFPKRLPGQRVSGAVPSKQQPQRRPRAARLSGRAELEREILVRDAAVCSAAPLPEGPRGLHQLVGPEAEGAQLPRPLFGRSTQDTCHCFFNLPKLRSWEAGAGLSGWDPGAALGRLAGSRPLGRGAGGQGLRRAGRRLRGPLPRPPDVSPRQPRAPHLALVLRPGSMGLPSLVFALLAACCCSHIEGVPKDPEMPAMELVEAEVGSTALLKCGPADSLGNFSHVDWFLFHKEREIPIFRVHQGQGWSEPGQYQHRLSLQGPGATLVLSQVTPHDEHSIFVCKSKQPLQDYYMELRVYKAPEEPTIQANAVGIHVDRQELREVATCVGRNGYPIPQVIWYKNGRSLQEEENRVQIQSQQIVESSGLYTLKSVLSAQLVKEDKDAQFYCELNYRLPSGNHMKESKEVTVPVFYPAEKVWLEIEPVGLLKEGDYVEIKCLTDGNPQPDFTIWKQNSSTGEMEEKTTNENGVLSLKPAQKQHSGLYQCQSLDLETMTTLSSDPQELLVNYVSDVRVSPTVPEAQEGGSLTLTCQAESNQDLEFQWLRDKTDQLLEKGSILQLNNLKQEAGGGYLCMASVPRVPGLNRTQLVNVGIVGPPWMALKKRKMWVKENTAVNLSCEASGHPRPTISWNINGSATEWNPDPQTVLSTLNVLVTPELLQTGAECTASSALGKNTTIIILELVTLTTLTPDSNQTTGLSTSTVSPHARANSTSTEKKLPQPESKGVVIVAVIVCVLVLAVLGAALYFFYKKGKLPCGRSGKQEITMPPSRKSEFVVEVKSDKLPEEMGLLQGSNGDKRAPGDQGEKYIDLRH